MKESFERKVRSPEEMWEVAEDFLCRKATGGLVKLSGDLGSGKTTFVQGLARALKVSEPITSPTFVYVKIYPAQHPLVHRLVHVDAYRVDLKNFSGDPWGLQEYLYDPSNLVCIEWPDHLPFVKNIPASELSFEIMSPGIHRVRVSVDRATQDILK